MRFYIACPANHVSGGTELLHQLSWHLSNRGIENYMVYRNVNPVFAPTADAFVKYQVIPVSCVVDAESSVLVLPETMLDMINLCQKGTIIIWWLSVDNYLTFYKDKICQRNRFDIFDLKEKNNLVHFVQSKYAKEFVENRLGVENALYLKDYINDDIVRIALQYRKQLSRENICLYNPKKGAEKLDGIRNRCREDIEWIPIIGLRADQVAMLMCKAKVYIDFGTHPGKDRIPREAAVCGCCIVTNREGSAAYSEDVGIPEEYKLFDMLDYDKVLDTIYDLIDNYDERVKKYEAYVASILNEKDEFEKDVDNMLDFINTRSICTTPSWKGNKYDELLADMQEMVSQICSNYANAQILYADKKVDPAISELLKVESSLSMLREASYMIINDMLSKE